MHSKKLLIIRLSALGDVAMLVPVVYSLAEQYPDLKITVLSQGFARPLFENLGKNVDFIIADTKKEHKNIPGLVSLFKELKKKDFTAIADMHDVLRSKVLRALFNMTFHKTAHIDKHRAGKKALCRQNNKVFEQQPLSIDNYRDVLAKLGFPVELTFKTIVPHSESIKKDPDTIGIAPFAAHKGKVYPIEKMTEVMRILIENGKKIYLFGGGSAEMAEFHNWQEMFGYEKVLIVGEIIKRDLLAEIKLMATLDVMISMDSANQHLASLAGTRVISIWGATHPYAGFKAYGQDDKDCVQVDLPCRPCSVYGNKPCMHGNYPCLNQISPEMITNKVIK